MADPLDTYLAPHQGNDDPLDGYLAEQQKAAAGAALYQRSNPDQAGRANVLGRQFGLPPETVERNLPDIETQAQIRRVQSLVDRYPAIGSWASDPRNAAVARDDLENIAKNARYWQGAVSGSIKATPAPAPTVGSFLSGVGTSFVEGARQMWAGARAAAADALPDLTPRSAPGVPRLGDMGGPNALADYERSVARSDAATPDFKSWYARDLYSGTSSLAQMVPSLAASIATGNPAPAIAAAGFQQGLPSYAKYRARGGTPGQAALGASLEGGAEAAGELLPMGFLVSKLGKVGLKPFLAGFLGRELPSELATTIAQDAADVAIANPDKTWGDFWSQLPADLRSTTVGVGVMGGFSGALNTAASRLNGRNAEQARASEAAATVSSIMDAATESKVRARDPQAFSALIERMAAGSPAERLFVPADKLAEYFQSNDMDYRSDDFWHDYSDQIDQGLATGGDVVIPTAQAAAHLAGTPAWEAIKPEVRVTPGGMSLSEAEAFEATKADELEKMGAEMSAQMESDRAALEPRQKIAESVRDRLMQAGYTPDAAQVNAELVASRYATRAARLGQSLTGTEADKIDIRRVLPEGLAPAVAADQLDVVIASMKGGKEAKARNGPSLLEFIAKAGGVQDTGGDVAAMGGRDWHREKPGRRKLIRESVQDQGGNANTLDELARSAWEAGYFRDMPDRPTTNDLLEAMDAELRGAPRFASSDESTTLDVRAAAEDLRGLLENKGLDPATATPKQIRDAVAEFQKEQTEGGTLFQRDALQSEEFKKWFGNSKIVDAAGNPRVVYHGGPNSIEAFQSDGAIRDDQHGNHGIYFSPSARLANSYAGSNSAGDKHASPTVYPVYLSVQNPLVIPSVDAKGFWEKLHAKLSEKAKADQKKADRARRRSSMWIAAKDLGEYQAQGYDGIINEDAGEIVVFDASQIKSVNNVGTFDPADPRILHQTFGDMPRGSVTFVEGRSVVQLFESSNLSTFLHEFGHITLEELKADAAGTIDTNGNASARQTFGDWEAVKAWFKANGHPISEDGAIPTEAHELWARGFERFLMEGKAPSSALRRVFDTFRSWLLQIYKVVDNLRSPITPEIREVMERLIATDEEINQARDKQAITDLFKSAADANMTDEEFAVYQASAATAKDAAFDALLYKTMQTIRQARTKAWKDEEAGVKADVTARINRRPEFRALHLLRTGKFLDSPDAEPIRAKLDTAWLVQTYGEDVLKTLPKSVPPIFAHERSTDADTIAELVGFRTGDEMVRTLIGLEQRQAELRNDGDKRSVKQRLIDEETTAEMRDRHGDPLNDGSIEEEALAAVLNEKQGEQIATELRLLQRKRAPGKPSTPYSLAKEWAQRTIREGKVADVASPAAVQRYARAAAKAAKEAEAAMLKGDVDETYRQKQRQMLNAALVSEARKAGEAIDSAVSRLGKLAKRATIKSVDQDYLDQAHALLEQVEFRDRSQASINRQESFSAWAQARQAEGHDVVVPGSFAESLGTTHWSRLTVEKLLGLDDTVKQIIHLGRMKQTLIDGKERREYEEGRGSIIGRIGEQPPLPPTGNLEPGRWGKFKIGAAGVHASLTKVGRMIFVLDGGDTSGPLHRLIWRPLSEALARENDIMAEVQQRNSESLRAVPKEILKRFDEHVSVPELPGDSGDTVWSRSQLHQMARNAGTAENWRVLCEGRGWDPVAAFAALDRILDKDEWEYIQRDLETVGSFWPEIKALYERMNGVAPPQITPKLIETRHGTFPGGYYPLVPDATANPKLDQQLKSDELFTVLHTRATTRNGFSNERTGATYVVSLAPGISQRHVMEVVHDFTHREAVMQADKLLSDSKIVTAMRDVIGVEMQQQFRPWLKHIANQWAQDKTGAEAAEKIANKMRTSMSVMGMGFRISTMVAQLGGYANSIEVLGADGEKWMLSGARSVASMGGKAAFEFASDRSGIVRHRLMQVDLTQAQELAKLQGKVGMAANARRFAFYGIGYMDRAVIVPTWHAGYNKAMAEGMGEEDAIAFADHAVEASQGGAGAMNTAAIQRLKGMSSLLVMFYSYGSAYYNRQAQLIRDTRQSVRERRVSDVPRLMARAWWLMLAPNIVSTLIQGLLGHGPDDDESYAAWLAMGSISGLFTGVPLVGGLVQSLTKGFDFSASPLDRAGTTLVRAAGDIWKTLDDYLPEVVPGSDPNDETHASGKWAKNTIESVGYIAGLPLGQASTPVQFTIDWANGKQDPEGVSDWYHGLMTGKIKDD